MKPIQQLMSGASLWVDNEVHCCPAQTFSAVSVRLFTILALALASFAAVPRLAPASGAAENPAAGISFDEIRRDASAASNDATEQAALSVLRSAPILGFQSDYDWFVSHGPDQYGERRGPAGEDIALYRYAFFGHWSRFATGNVVCGWR